MGRMGDDRETLAGFVGAEQTPTPTSAGVRIDDRYEVLGLVGTGGMGSVYKVRDAELDEIVALKMLRQELLRDSGMLARFRQEVKLARRVAHPNVVRTFDLGQSASGPARQAYTDASLPVLIRPRTSST